MSLRCLIVDVEPLARTRLRNLLDESETSIEIVAEAGGGKDAVSLIHDCEPDVVFLDVQMPVLDGFDVVDLLPGNRSDRLHIVFVAAYDEYALQAFEVHALDYLTKPVRLGREVPLEIARLEPGAREAERLLGRIEHGIPA